MTQVFLHETENLKYSFSSNHTIILGKKGSSIKDQSGEPIVIIDSSLGNLQIDDLKALSLKRINDTVLITDIKIQKQKAITLAGLDAYMIEAHVTSTKDHKEEFFVQYMMKQPKGYYIIQAKVSLNKKDLYLKEIQQVINNFRLK